MVLPWVEIEEASPSLDPSLPCGFGVVVKE